MNLRLWIVFFLLVFTLYVYLLSTILESNAMQNNVQIELPRPILKNGDSWFIICALSQQLPLKKEKLKKYRPLEDIEAEVAQRKQALSYGNLPPDVKLQSLGGHTLWRKFACMVKQNHETGGAMYRVTVTNVGFYGVSDDILSKHGLKASVTPKSILVYYFSNKGMLLQVDLLDGKGPIRIEDGAFLCNWDDTEFPASIPDFRRATVDRGEKVESWAGSQAVRIDRTEATIWLSRNLYDIRPVKNIPGVDYEVQKWSSSGQWWNEAFVVRDGRVDLVAKKMQ